jgi:tetratricopeptide (TPR) repeat protein
VSAAADEAGYTLRGIEEMLGMSRHVVMGFVKAGFVVPTRGPRNAHRFDFQDVVLLRTAQTLRAADIPARRIHRSLKRLRAQLPASAPLTGLRITAVGDDIAVRDAGQDVALESGQFLLDFDVASGPGAVLRFPDHKPREHDAAAWIAQAEALAPTDRAGATAAYRRAIDLDPVDAQAWLGLGALLHDARDFDAALALYDEALDHLPDHPDLHYNRAITLEDLARPDDAVTAYEACLRVAPDHADAHWNAARLYEERGAEQQALKHFSAFRRLQR